MPDDSDTNPTLHRALARGRGPPNGERPVALVPRPACLTAKRFFVGGLADVAKPRARGALGVGPPRRHRVVRDLEAFAQPAPDSPIDAELEDVLWQARTLCRPVPRSDAE